MKPGPQWFLKLEYRLEKMNNFGGSPMREEVISIRSFVSWSLVFLLVFPAFRILASSNHHSRVQTLKDLHESKKDNGRDTIEPFLYYQLIKRNSTASQRALYSGRLKLLAEKRLLSLEAGDPLRNVYKRYLAFAYNDIGILNRDKGDVLKALEYLHKSLKLNEELGNNPGVGVCYNNIAQIDNDIGDLDGAIGYLEKGLRLLSRDGNREELAHMTGNLGYFYSLKNKPQLALRYYQQSLQQARAIGEKYIQALALNRIGKLLAQQNNPLEAMNYYRQSLSLYRQAKSLNGEATVLNNIGECCLQQCNYREAVKHSEASLQIGKELGNVSRIRQAALTLKNIYKKLNQPVKELEMYELYVQMRDSTNNEMIRKSAIRKQLAYDYEKREIILKEEHKRLKRLYEQKQKFYIILSLVSVVLILIVFYSLYLRYKFLKEQESKNIHIGLKERLRKEIEEKESIANSIISIQEKEREKLAAELHDGVNQLLFAAKIQMQAARSTEEEMHRDAVKLVESAIQEIRSIAGNQGSFLLNNKSLKDALTDLILQMKGNGRTRISFFDHGLAEALLHPDLKINVLRIVQELLNNVIRHSGASSCTISMKTARRKIMLAVSDTGTGMETNKINPGNGLKNIDNKVTLMRGKKRVFTIKGQGTKVYIEIPLKEI